MNPCSTVIWIGKLHNSPLGDIWAAASADGLIAIDLWQDEERFRQRVVRLKNGLEVVQEPERLADILCQVAEYLQNSRRQFEIAIDWSVMSPFQHDVLEVVSTIPYGSTSTYKDIAARLGKPEAVRAVGRANATNPIPIVIPCHRVLGADGRLHGFSAPGGLETKAWLLRREGSWLI